MSDDERVDLLAGARASLHVVRTLDGRPRVCGNITSAEKRALAEAIETELAALHERGFRFDPENVVRAGLIAVVTADDGTEIVIDPLSMLVPLLATVPEASLDDDPLAPRH